MSTPSLIQEATNGQIDNLLGDGAYPMTVIAFDTEGNFWRVSHKQMLLGLRIDVTVVWIAVDGTAVRATALRIYDWMKLRDATAVNG